jgi:hypothetical protein
MAELTPLLPYPPDWTVRRALAAYHAENGFSVDEYDKLTTQVSLFGIKFSVLNTKSHARALRYHDLHHVVTGYGTDLTGEGEISAYEVRGGVWSSGVYVSTIIVSVAAFGFVMSPRRVWRAFAASRGTRDLWDLDHAYESLLDMSVGELRELCGVPRDGLAKEPRKLHTFAPKNAIDAAI